MRPPPDELMPDFLRVQAMWNTNLNGAGALGLLCWDICITFGDEVQYIWPKPNFSPIKWLFFFNRYLALLAQIGFRIAMLSIFTISNKSITLPMCRMLWICQAIAVQSLLLSMEIILMMRVYALYNKRRWTTVLLVCVLLAENIILPASMAHAIPTIPFQPACLVLHVPHSLVYVSVATVFTQLTILGLTIAKHVFAIRAGWGKTPIVSLMLRDGTWVFFAIIIVAAVTTDHEVRSTCGNNIFWWFLSIISLSLRAARDPDS